MIHYIRTSKLSKIIASYLAMQLIIATIQPWQLFALTEGPSQPEFKAFTPIGTSDMVDLSSGNFNYNIPIIDVGGYPLNLAYNSGISMDQEASWVGLGWNLNVGQISRNVRGLPDDFKGDKVIYDNNIRNNVTVGVNTKLSFPVFGNHIEALGNGNVNLGVKYNNYDGFTFNSSYGASFDLSEQVSAGLNISSSESEGVTVTPSVGIKSKKKTLGEQTYRSFTGNLGIPFNSRQGIMGVNIGLQSTKEVENKGSKSLSKSSINNGITFNDALTFTPNSSNSFTNLSLTLNLGLGTEIFGIEGPQVDLKGFGAIQWLNDDDKHKEVKAYGYANTEHASPLNAVLDFNRENKKNVSKNTTVLSPTNYTYDTYSIQGQGISGMFRPQRSQVGHVYDQTTISTGDGLSVGYEAGLGAGFHIGGNIKVNPSYTRSGRWDDATNTALNNFKIRNNDPNQNAFYEPTYYKMIGELTADNDMDIYTNKVHQDKAMRIDIGGAAYKRKTRKKYDVKNYASNGTISYQSNNINGYTKRTSRNVRNQSVQMITLDDVLTYPDGQIRNNTLPTGVTIPKHHQIGAKIVKPDGSTYVFGETAYNTKKVEATFALGTTYTQNCKEGTVTYTPGIENSTNNNKGKDHYFNRIETPAYAHSYLLTSVLSSDYQDLTNDGPTPDDLGAYTVFHYNTPQNYNWRVPFEANTATYNEGFKTDTKDQKGSYVYGEKQLKYIDVIETKTHVAVFDISNRQDAVGVQGENGGIGSGRMQKLNKIELYTQSEYQKLLDGDTSIFPIKTAHFVYDYSLCVDVKNNLPGFNVDGDDIDNELSNNGGKLTLKQVYFTYRNSKMGKYTPYEFHYDNFNPKYQLKSYDIWGNYKPMVNEVLETDNSGNVTLTTNAAGIQVPTYSANPPNDTFCDVQDDATAAIFPFVQQQDKALQDAYATAWTISSIDLPSGGKIELELESDDYGYVQDKTAMEMFKVVGVGGSNTSLGGTTLEGNYYVHVEVPNGTTTEQFKSKYLKDIGIDDSHPMYFRFLTNMTSASHAYEYVTGYANINRDDISLFDDNSTGLRYAAIKLKSVDKEGGFFSSNEPVNPISKAGWHLGRKYLNKQVYGIDAPEMDQLTADDLLQLGESFINVIEDISHIFTGPNQRLKENNVANYFIPEKSWVRLYHPTKNKLGGGLRVKKVMMHDNWDDMNGITSSAHRKYYGNFYGQEYHYNDSGVATFEPNGSKENPLIQPIFDKPERLSVPDYSEKPFSQSLYPSPTVTYGKVTVNNLERSEADGQITKVVKKHATGDVISEFFTSKDFPTKTDYTDIDGHIDITGILGSILKVKNSKKITYSQGFMIHTNDMNGKSKSQTVRSESQRASNLGFISKVEYKYSTNEDNTLNNYVDVIDKDGQVSQELVGVNYDVIQDFDSYTNETISAGFDGNLAGLLFWIGWIPVPNLPSVYQHHQKELKTAVTTKVVHSVGILKEKVAYDLGARVSTKNIAWDGNSGNVLLTETVNEYGDNYYNINYPAYWYYPNMGNTSETLGATGILRNTSDSYFAFENPLNNTLIPDGLKLGDEVIVEKVNNTVQKLWVVNSVENLGVEFMDAQGNLITNDLENAICKVYTSGKQNVQSASMASITLQENPLKDSNGDDRLDVINRDASWNSEKVVNGSAIEYSDAWEGQCEFRLPNTKGALNTNGDLYNAANTGVNPYLYNVKGNWRAVKSYAYLEGRNNGEESFNPRKEGFLKTFTPFYTYSNTNNTWELQDPSASKWTFASEVTQFSPYGAEIENKDALGRHSSAQYGFQYTLPTAVGSNTMYSEMGYDSFEDYDYEPLNGDASTAINPHFGFQDVVAANGNTSITTSYSHTGTSSLQINASSEAMFQKEVAQAPCLNSEEIQIALLDVLNRLREMYFNNTIPTDDCFTIPELEVLAPYIVLPAAAGNVDPQICNLTIGCFPDAPCDSSYPEFFIAFNFANQGITATLPNDFDFDIDLRWYNSSSPGSFTHHNALTSMEIGYNPGVTGNGTNDGTYDPNTSTSSIAHGEGGGHTKDLGHRYIDFSETNCPECVSFTPKPSKKYVVYGWVNESPNAQEITYNNSNITIDLLDSGDDVIANNTFIAEGDIIEGWQRIYGEFTIPADAVQFRLRLINNTSQNIFFDDIKIHPFDANMKSFVYDPVTLRLMSELDENHYATFYEYDYEGGLVRVKKETEKGVYTIQETRSKSAK